MDEKQKNDEKKKNRQYILLGSLVVVMIAIIAVMYFMTASNSDPSERELAYTELIEEVNAGNVESVEMTVGSTTAKVKLKGVEEEKTCIIPSTQAFIELMQQKYEEGNEFELLQKPTNIFVRISSTLFSLSLVFLLKHPVIKKLIKTINIKYFFISILLYKLIST